MIDAFNHVDWDAIAARGGVQVATEDRLGMLQGIKGGEIATEAATAQLGLPVHISGLPNGGSSSGFEPIAVDAFSFSDGGSAYTVAPAANGTLVGSKDGQPWSSWAIGNLGVNQSGLSEAEVALQTLTSVADSHLSEPANSGARLSGVNMQYSTITLIRHTAASCAKWLG